MQTYKLINNTTKEETICSLVTIDGFNYYVSDNKIKKGDTTISGNTTLKFGWNWGFNKIKDDKQAESENQMAELTKSTSVKTPSLMFKVLIATNNPNIDIPKVIDEVNIIIKNAFYDKKGDFKRSTIGADDWINGLKLGYNKAKETYQFTEEDIFGLKDLLQNTSPLMFEVVARNYIRNLKETKTIYYE